MFQRKLIAVLGVAVLLAFTAGTSFASVARVQSMDLDSPYASQFTDDYVNIYMFPTSVVRQNNLVLAELGETDGSVDPVSYGDRSMTLVKMFPKFGAIAFDMRQSLRTNDSELAGSSNSQLLDIIWGKAFTKMDLAARFQLGNSSLEYSDNTTGGTGINYEDHGAGFLGVGFNIAGWPNAFDPYPFDPAIPGAATAGGVELNYWGVTPAIAFHFQNEGRLEGAVTFGEYSIDRKITGPAATPPAGNETWQDAGNLSYSINVRGVFPHGDKDTWYPAAWYVNNDLGYDVTNYGGVAGQDRNVDETYKNWGIGVSNNMKVNDNNLLLFGIAVSTWEHEYTRTDNNAGGAAGDVKTYDEKDKFLPAFFASLETQATSWLTLRMGANQNWDTFEVDQTDFATPTSGSNSATLKASSFDMRFGAGIKWNNLDIDMTMNNVFPFTGGWILSGDPASPFTHVSATYHF
jgi:hypothetical protein